MDKRCAIFDMDGTLVDSMVYWERLGREFLASKGVTDGVEPVLDRIKPMTMLESAALFIEAFDFPGTPEDLAAEMNAVMEDHYRRDIPLKSGAADYLASLKKRGVRLCVATATPEELAVACLERLGVAGCFVFILSCDAVTAGKDRPDVFLEAARRLNAVPGDIAAYEDALYALETAKSAGFYTVGVYDDSSAAVWPQVCALADETITEWQKAL